MKSLVSILVVLFSPGILSAALSDADVAAVAKFLAADYASARENQPAAALPRRAFYVAETGTKDVVSDEDARKAKDLYAAILPLGEYRELWIVSDLESYGTVVRKAFLGPRGAVSWCDDLQGAAGFALRAELGQRGGERLMDLPEEMVLQVFRQARRGEAADDVHLSDIEKKRHLETMDLLFSVALLRS